MRVFCPQQFDLERVKRDLDWPVTAVLQVFLEPGCYSDQWALVPAGAQFSSCTDCVLSRTRHFVGNVVCGP